jgi:hypothetical protein
MLTVRENVSEPYDTEHVRSVPVVSLVTGVESQVMLVQPGSIVQLIATFAVCQPVQPPGEQFGTGGDPAASAADGTKRTSARSAMNGANDFT